MTALNSLHPLVFHVSIKCRMEKGKLHVKGIIYFAVFKPFFQELSERDENKENRHALYLFIEHRIEIPSCGQSV